MTELKQELGSYKAEQEGWERTAKKYEDLFATETSDFRRQMYEEALQGDRQNVEIFQNKIDQTSPPPKRKRPLLQAINPG